jgi:DNA-binding transcriptional MerR regulator
MTRYTVRQVADIARVSVRTLHHYDDIGLLKPAFIGNNGYRYYEARQLYRLQHILMYREFGLALDEIKTLVDAPDFDVADALKRHRERLVERLKQDEELIRVIDDTLARIGGGEHMDDSKLYNWNSPEKQAEYEAWLIERYGPQAEDWLAHSRKRFDALDDAGRQAAMDRLKAIEGDLVDAYRRGMPADSRALKPVLDRHREWVAYMWNKDCPPGAYVILADMYLGHPDFLARFNALADGFADWLPQAMKAYAA